MKFTPEELKKLAAVPKDELMALITSQLAEMVDLTRQIFKERTGTEMPKDYMKDYPEEFKVSVKSHGHQSEQIWAWKGDPIVRQVQTLELKDGHLEGSFRTARC